MTFTFNGPVVLAHVCKKRLVGKLRVVRNWENWTRLEASEKAVEIMIGWRKMMPQLNFGSLTIDNSPVDQRGRTQISVCYIYHDRVGQTNRY
jgi:hypothetical protein